MSNSHYTNVLDSDFYDPSRVQSPRPETPEPYVRQGRRNASTGVQLLDDEGAISEKFERCLKHIFAKYCTPRPTIMHSPVKQHVPLDRDLLESPIIENGVDAQLLIPPPGAYFTAAALDQWATDTNGTPLPKEAKEELELLDVTEEGNLTFQGFLQIYQLQTENDEEETWRDLSTHGFDRNLTLVTTRREDMEEELPNDQPSRETTPTGETSIKAVSSRPLDLA